jgi:hypothetical protein
LPISIYYKKCEEDVGKEGRHYHFPCNLAPGLERKVGIRSVCKLSDWLDGGITPLNFCQLVNLEAFLTERRETSDSTIQEMPTRNIFRLDETRLNTVCNVVFHREAQFLKELE